VSRGRTGRFPSSQPCEYSHPAVEFSGGGKTCRARVLRREHLESGNHPNVVHVQRCYDGVLDAERPMLLICA
jgi:hypothetical protein